MFEEAEQFIDNYGEQIQAQFRESTISFSLGAIAFHQKKYADALTHLLQVDQSNLLYRLDCDALILKIYFEQAKTEAFLSWVKSFKNFLKNNNSLLSKTKKPYHNFIKFTNNLYRIKALHSSKSPQQIGEAIATAKDISNKKWLLEKVAELAARK